MKLKKTIILITFIILTIQFVYSHPMDTSRTDLYFYKDLENREIGNKAIGAVFYLNWEQATMLAEKFNNVKTPEIKDLPDFKDTYINFIKNEFLILNNDNKIKITEITVPDKEEQEILLGRGIGINMTFQADLPFENIKISNTMFFDFFPTQNNVINMLIGKDKILLTEILSVNNSELVYNLKEEKLKTKGSRARGDNKKTMFDRLSE